MGMADYQLLADLVTHLAECKGPILLFDPAMKNHLEQHIAQLFTEQVSVLKVDSLDSLAGLLDEVALDRLMGLFSVPRTAALASQ